MPAVLPTWIPSRFGGAARTGTIRRRFAGQSRCLLARSELGNGDHTSLAGSASRSLDGAVLRGVLPVEKSMKVCLELLKNSAFKNY